MMKTKWSTNVVRFIRSNEVDKVNEINDVDDVDAVNENEPQRGHRCR